MHHFVDLCADSLSLSFVLCIRLLTRSIGLTPPNIIDYFPALTLHKIIRQCIVIVKPRVGHAHDFLCVIDEIGCPPAKCGICDNGVFAASHELHLLGGICLAIALYELKAHIFAHTRF